MTWWHLLEPIVLQPVIRFFLYKGCCWKTKRTEWGTWLMFFLMSPPLPHLSSTSSSFPHFLFFPCLPLSANCLYYTLWRFCLPLSQPHPSYLARSWRQKRQSGLKRVWWVLVWELWLSENFSRGRHVAQDWGYGPGKFYLIIIQMFLFLKSHHFLKMSSCHIPVHYRCRIW